MHEIASLCREPQMQESHTKCVRLDRSGDIILKISVLAFILLAKKIAISKCWILLELDTGIPAVKGMMKVSLIKLPSLI